MIPGQYPTAGDARVYINEFWIDDTLRVDYSIDHPKIPMWGYHQKYTADVAAGKVLVTGNMMIHFRYPGYLMYAISQKLGREAVEELSRRLQTDENTAPVLPGQASGQNNAPYTPVENNRSAEDLIQLIDSIRHMTPEQRIQRLVEAGVPGEFTRVSDIMNALYNDTVGEAEANRADYLDPVEMGPNDYANGRKGFDIDILYSRAQDNYGRGYYMRETIEGVHLTRRRKIINAATTGSDLGGSGQSLVEIYPFIARKVKRYVSEYEGRTSAEMAQAIRSETDNGIHSMVGGNLTSYDVITGSSVAAT